MLKAVRDPLLSLIYPQECRVCSSLVESRDDGVACAACWALTHVFTGDEMLCDKCGTLLGERSLPKPVYCHKCDNHSYDKACAFGVYENALSASVVDLKSNSIVPIRLLRALRGSAQRYDLARFDLLIPVPLSRQRRTERGFNQAESIARELSKITSVPIDAGSLSRKVNTPIHRIGMDQRARELTVMKAFDVGRPKLIAGKNISLVDDVLTSGETASACARVLKKNGAASVSVFTLARAVLH